MLLLIDFEKAFDSVAWSFINKVLKFYNFGQNIVKWFNLFYKNSCSSVIINGHMSDWFYVQRGCRQGDPLSPYIFILCAEILAIRIRNNVNIQGIKIGNEQFLITQYADDTSLLLDGSEKSLVHSLRVLKLYASISGLKMNTDKTKVVWFGSRRGSEIRYYQNENLCWEDQTFTVLGIKFSLNLSDMIELNYNVKIDAIRKLFDNWSKRILTPLGKISVIKSLALSQLNYLLASLPNPGDIIMKRLNNMFYNFLWSGKPDKIKRIILTQDYNNGGLRMVDLENFIYSMKITWIRRYIHQPKTYFSIFNFMCPFMNDFQNFGAEFISTKIKRINNPFWKDVFSSYKVFLDSLKPRTWDQFLSQPIWFNSNFKVGGTCMFYRNWYERGIRFVNDLLDENGSLLSYENVTQMFDLRTNFLDFRSVITTVRRFLTMSNLNVAQCKLNVPFLPFTLIEVLRNKKGCRDMYDILVTKTVHSPAIQKWQNDILLPENFKWNDLIPHLRKCTKDTTLIWFEIRIMHRILATNSLLQKMNILLDNRCSFGCGEEETIIHLFCDCRFVEPFWRRIHSLINVKCNLNIPEWNNVDILFGNKTLDKVINKIILQAKFYIYRSRGKQVQPHASNFMKEIRFLYDTEKVNAFKNNRTSFFYKSWEPYKGIITEDEN